MGYNNGLECILNTTFLFFFEMWKMPGYGPPPKCGIFHIFFFFLTGSLILYIQSEYSAVNLIVSSFHLNSLNEKNVVMSA